MELTIAVLNKIGFEEIPNQPKRTFIQRKENILVYEFQEPIWLVQLDDVIGNYSNMMIVQTEADIVNALKQRNIR